MSQGLDHLLSSLVSRRDAYAKMAHSCPEVDSTYRYQMSEISRLDNQIERVLNLLERD